VYQQFFGLADEPFRLTPDPRYLFPSAKHAEALAHLRLGLTESSGFVCITGDVGTGKTTLLRFFLAELGPEVTAAYALTPPLSAFDLVRRICGEFGVPTQGRNQVDLVQELHAHLMAQDAAGRVSVVVLDEAQALSVDLLEQIRLLLNLETETRKLLRIVLVGQPQLRKLLLDPDLAQLNQRITLRWHLDPLSYRETVAYVHHRLAIASGGRSARLFTRPALRLLYGVSGGVPRLVNMVAHRALLAAFVAREPRVRRRLVARAYRELQAVPLPGTLSVARKATLAAGGLAIGVALVAFGAPTLDRLLAVQPSAATPDPPPSPAPPAVHDRAAPKVAVEPDPPPTAAEPAPTPPAVAAPAAASAPEFTDRLARIDTPASARAAAAAVLAAWGANPLDPGETRLPDGLEAIAWRRGLQELQLTANRSMLRLLDLPALLEVHVGGLADPRYVALMGMSDSQVVLSVDGASLTVDSGLLDRFWTGQARILWRDADGIDETLRLGAKGIAVLHLQEFLRQGGAYGGEISGTFDADTARAVVNFQRSHQLDADGLVGPLTRIVLYAAGAGRARPALAIQTGTAS